MSSSKLDSVQACCLNPTSVHDYFEHVKDALEGKYGNGIPLEEHNIFAMDETGFMLNGVPRQTIYARPSTKTQHQTVDASRENITVICTICADGNPAHSPVPMVIHKAEHWTSDAWGHLSKEQNPMDLE